MKIFSYFVIAVVTISVLVFWYQFYIMGRYYEHAGLLFTVFVGLSPLVLLFAVFKLVQTIHNEKSI